MVSRHAHHRVHAEQNDRVVARQIMLNEGSLRESSMRRLYLPEVGSFELTDTVLAGEIRFGTRVIDEHSVQFDPGGARKALLSSFEDLESRRVDTHGKVCGSLQCVHRRCPDR